MPTPGVHWIYYSGLSIEDLRNERSALLRRFKAGEPGVNDIRARLKVITTQILRKETKDG